ncbi:MAG: HAD family hydrolase [Ectobacillus sp.]
MYTNKGIYVPRNWKENILKAFYTASSRTHSLELEELERITEQQLQSDIITFFDDVEEILAEEIEIAKFFISTLDGNKREQLMRDLRHEAGIMLTASTPTNLEIMHENGHKGNGLKAMARYFNVPLKDTIAIGDNFNDVPMLQAAGFSIAMGNAEDEVKEMCDAVTLTNEEDGVAEAIETYVLKQLKQR